MRAMEAPRNYPLLFAKGMAMGAADVVPGVSGGTVAFITGIYEELIDSLRSLEPAAARTLFQEGVAAFWQRINGSFLAVLFAGVITSILSLAKLVSHLLEHFPLLLWSFFFGLILASVLHMVRQQRAWGVGPLAGLGVGLLFALGVALSPEATLPVTPATIFLSGMLAICAMILPGISGSFILLLLGMYAVVIEAIAAVDPGVLALFASGAVIGLVVFSHVLSWFLHRYRAVTLALLIGFLAGSLVMVWPWRGAGAGAPLLLLPGDYAALHGDARLPACIGLMLAGLVLVLGLEFLGTGAPTRKRPRWR